MNFINFKCFLTLSLLLCSSLLQAQIDTIFTPYKLNFKKYLRLVGSKNLQYAAEKYNINIADAAVESAKVFPDPTLAFGWERTAEGNNATGNEYTAEIGKTIELGGKRKARIDLAKSSSMLSRALLDDYFRNLRAEAALVYLEALKQQSLFKVKYNSWKVMKQLAESDSVRFSLGSIMEIDAIQSKLEAGIQLNDVIQAEAEWKNAFAQLALMTGGAATDTLYSPTGKLYMGKRSFISSDLITSALNNRADLVAALYNKEVSQKALTLARKERNIDLDLNIAYGQAHYSPGTPTENIITGGLAIPLKFSNRYKGEIKIAEFQIIQAENLYKQAEIQIKTEITQAWQQYDAFCKQAQSYDKGLLDNAERVRKGKIYSYNRGESSLLEVLNAQRIYNDTQASYIETLFNCASALVEVEKAAGIWDVDF